MRRSACFALAAFLVLGGLSGCATTDGTLSGDLLGPLEGGFLGDYSYRKEKGLEETRQIHSEPPATTDANVRIEAIRAVPDILDPGDTIDIRIKYAVLTPQEDMTVIVNETREILFEENRVGEASANIEREGGTWRSSVPITLPQNASPGIYRIVVSIRTPNGEKDVEEVTFRVR